MIGVITSWQIDWVLNLFQTTAFRNIVIVSFEQSLTGNTYSSIRFWLKRCADLGLGVLLNCRVQASWCFSDGSLYSGIRALDSNIFACGEFLILISNPKALSS